MSVKTKATIVYLGSAIVVIGLGLGSRHFGAHLPEFIATYAGDTLWALLVSLVVSAVTPDLQLRYRAAIALVVSCLVELSQLYHAPWIDGIRATKLGGLVLGFGFLWSDLACYAVGVGLGMSLEWAIRHRVIVSGKEGGGAL